MYEMREACLLPRRFHGRKKKEEGGWVKKERGEDPMILFMEPS